MISEQKFTHHALLTTDSDLNLLQPCMHACLLVYLLNFVCETIFSYAEEILYYHFFQQDCVQWISNIEVNGV